MRDLLCKKVNVSVVLFILATAMSLQAEVNRWSKIGPGGGDILKLIMDPHSSQTIYAITNNAGLFKTTDGALQWHSIDEDLPDAENIGCLAINPQNSAILYTGAYPNFYQSLDGGENWFNIGNTEWTVPLAAGTRVCRRV